MKCNSCGGVHGSFWASCPYCNNRLTLAEGTETIIDPDLEGSYRFRQTSEGFGLYRGGIMVDQITFSEPECWKLRFDGDQA